MRNLRVGCGQPLFGAALRNTRSDSGTKAILQDAQDQGRVVLDIPEACRDAEGVFGGSLRGGYPKVASQSGECGEAKKGKVCVPRQMKPLYPVASMLPQSTSIKCPCSLCFCRLTAGPESHPECFLFSQCPMIRFLIIISPFGSVHLGWHAFSVPGWRRSSTSG